MKAVWTQRPITEVCKFVGGGQPPKNTFKYEPADGLVRLLQIRDFSRDDKAVFVNRNDVTKTCEINDVMIGRYGASVGKIMTGKAGAYNVALIKATPDENLLSKKFLFSFLKSKQFQEALLKRSDRGAQNGFNRKDLAQINIPLPPLEEQRRIVAVLDKAFAALDRAREYVEANLADLSEAIDSFIIEKTSSLGEITQLGKVVEIQTGFAFKSKGYTNGPDDIRLVRGDNIIQGRFRWENVKKWPKATFSEYKKFQLAVDDVLLAMDRTWVKDGIKVAKIEEQDLPSLLVQRVARIRAKEEIIPEFIFIHMKSKAFENYVVSIQTGSGVPHISQKQIQAYEFRLPSIEDQKNLCHDIDAYTTAFDQIEGNLLQRLSDISDLRQSILERAFAGELTQTSPSIAINDNERDERLSTATLVLAYEKHRLEERQKTFGHVKAQKSLHLTESIAGLDLGRQPQVRQAGPHDQAHFNRVETWAAQNDIFRFEQRRTGKRGYDFIRGKNYAAFLSEAETLLADYQAGLSRFLPLMTHMSTEEAEVFTTVHAAWNNLLVDGKTPSDEDVVWAAREGWHDSKTNIDRQKFFNAIRIIRRHDLEPDGSAKFVHGATERLL